MYYLCTRFTKSTALFREFSSAGSEHLPYKQRVGGSNPSTPTKPRSLRGFFYIMPTTYILYSAHLDKYYIGHTTGPMEDRLHKHLSDHVGYTGKAKDWVVVWQQVFDSKAESYRMERTIKNWKSRKKIETLVAGV
jgi:putative endonuclease